ncbi:ricin B lectin domain-containing protein [Mycena amicta]|nr:ricin B lectin domain-containing protein [Mycena amicta]
MFFPRASPFLFAAALLVLHVAAQDPGETVLFETVLAAAPGKCLSASANANGAAVVIGDCTPTANNSWVVPNGQGTVTTLKVFGDKCLDVKDGVNADGTKLQIWTCATGNTNQEWTTGGWDQTITWAGKNKCLDVTDGKAVNGQPIQIWDCDWTNDNQRWNDPAVTKPKFFTITWQPDPTLCIGAQIKGINASVAILKCNASSPAQRFTDDLNIGQIRPWSDDANANLCIAPRANLTTSGINLVTLPCDAGASTQLWNHPGGLGYIINRETDGFHNCMDLRDGNASPGVPIQIWDCTQLAGQGDNRNQDWNVTNFY